MEITQPWTTWNLSHLFLISQKEMAANVKIFFCWKKCKTLGKKVRGHEWFHRRTKEQEKKLIANEWTLQDVHNHYCYAGTIAKIYYNLHYIWRLRLCMPLTSDWHNLSFLYIKQIARELLHRLCNYKKRVILKDSR